jgi:hypothetical protein
MRRLAVMFALLASLLAAPAAFAQVLLSFHSFNGSWVGGRFPHGFIVLEGTLEATGEKVSENYGYTAETAGPAVLGGPVRHAILIEKAKYITTTNRHFTVPISDATYRQVVAEVAAWRDAPGKAYDLDTNNCIHFIGRMAQLAGLKVDYPKKLLRRPKAWLNHVTTLNPQLGAKPIR